MKKSILYVGIDIDDLAFHGAGYDAEKEIITVNQYNRMLYIVIVPKCDEFYKTAEKVRILGSKLLSKLNEAKIKEVALGSVEGSAEYLTALAEGIALANYKFFKYFKDQDKKKPTLETIHIYCDLVKDKDISEINNIVDGVYIARDLMNEPFSGLNAPQLGEEIEKIGKTAGFTTEILKRKQIETLKMGGLLAVNKGSAHTPVFAIMEWKSENAVNEKPIVLVGKGIVFDAGGLSIKPTPNSMDLMKMDMGGAAAVIGAMYSVSTNKLPLHVIALVPATDNAVDANSYVPGDVITMYNKLTVEVLNTDAEGRLVLADALSYAKKYDPEMAFDVATLTGAAARAFGKYGIVAMGTACDDTFGKLENSGRNVYERIAKVPFWDEYAELIKSKIADIKNIGGVEAGAITAGKFLEYFVDYPWIHLDIAGPSILSGNDAYRTEGGSGTSTRLLFDFLKNRSNM